MAVKTIYTCDKCGEEQLTPAQFWTVGVTATCQLYSSDVYVKGKVLQVCRPCLESFGIHVTHRPGAVKPATIAPSTEDLIREIVQRSLGTKEQP